MKKLSNIPDANIVVIPAESHQDTGSYPIARLDFDAWGNLQMWQGSPRLAHWRDEFPECDVLVQVDIERMSILEMLSDSERETLLSGWPIVTGSIDPAVFGEQAAELLDDDEEQTSGTDVLPADQPSDCLGCPLLADRPNDCSGCPLHRAKEHKSDAVIVSAGDKLFLRYLLWKEVHHNGYTVQIGQILSRLFPGEKAVLRD